MLVDGLKKLLTTHFFRSEREALNRIYHESNKQNKTKQTKKNTHPSKKFIVYKATKTSIEELCTCEVHYIL